MSDVRDKLPTEIREKQRTLVRAHNNRNWLLILGFFALCFAALQLLQAQLFALGITVLIADFVLFFYAVFVLIPRADAGHCVRIGFVCPACNAPLYHQSSIYGDTSALITRGACPRCEHSFLTNNIA